jgi:hypothetical protein
VANFLDYQKFTRLGDYRIKEVGPRFRTISGDSALAINQSTVQLKSATKKRQRLGSGIGFLILPPCFHSHQIPASTNILPLK